MNNVNNTNTGGTFRTKRNPFTQVSNTALRDSNLSLKAKGLYSLIQSYITMPNFVLYKGYLMSLCKEKEKAFDSAWKELKDNGYLKQYRIPKGKNDTFVYEYDLLDIADLTTPSLVNLNKNGEEIKTDSESLEQENGNWHTPLLVPYANGTVCQGYTMPTVPCAKRGGNNNTSFNNNCDNNNDNNKEKTDEMRSDWIVLQEIKNRLKRYSSSPINDTFIEELAMSILEERKIIENKKTISLDKQEIIENRETIDLDKQDIIKNREIISLDKQDITKNREIISLDKQNITNIVKGEKMEKMEKARRAEKKEDLENAPSAKVKHLDKPSMKKIDNRDDYTAISELVKSQISYSTIIHDRPASRELVDEIVEVIVTTICSKFAEDKIQMKDQFIPADVVKGLFWKLDMFDILFFLDSFEELDTKVVKLVPYIRTSLFVNKQTISHHYSNRVKLDMIKNAEEKQAKLDAAKI